MLVAIAAGLALNKTSRADDAVERNATLSRDNLPGLQETTPPWPPEYTKLADRIAQLKLPLSGDESYHFHVLVSVYIDGKREEVPQDIGIEPGASTMSPIHTHDAKGVVHIEASEKFPFRLGDVFGVWGVPLTSTTIGGYQASGGESVYVYVNGKRMSQNSSYKLKDRDNVVVGYGTATSFPHEPPSGELDSI
ncbi:MAG: hypothetical protein JHC98_05790 [Thermoleophilaceae bacterium]|nr:hypothetical protein [Thermoleophilaceae bacterium]